MVYQSGYERGVASLGNLALSEHLEGPITIAASPGQSVDAASFERCAADAMGAPYCSITLLIESRGEQPQIKLWGCAHNVSCPMPYLQETVHGEIGAVLFFVGDEIAEGLRQLKNV